MSQCVWLSHRTILTIIQSARRRHPSKFFAVFMLTNFLVQILRISASFRCHGQQIVTWKPLISTTNSKAEPPLYSKHLPLALCFAFAWAILKPNSVFWHQPNFAECPSWLRDEKAFTPDLEVSVKRLDRKQDLKDVGSDQDVQVLGTVIL